MPRQGNESLHLRLQETPALPSNALLLSSVEDSKKSVATRRVGEAHELASDLLDPAIDLAVAVRRFVLTERAIDIRRNLLPLIFPLE